MSGFAIRGVIEGFYGNPWTHEQRLDCIRFIGRHGMNTSCTARRTTRSSAVAGASRTTRSRSRGCGEVVDVAADAGVSRLRDQPGPLDPLLVRGGPRAAAGQARAGRRRSASRGSRCCSTTCRRTSRTTRTAPCTRTSRRRTRPSRARWPPTIGPERDAHACARSSTTAAATSRTSQRSPGARTARRPDVDRPRDLLARARCRRRAPVRRDRRSAAAVLGQLPGQRRRDGLGAAHRAVPRARRRPGRGLPRRARQPDGARRGVEDPARDDRRVPGGSARLRSGGERRPRDPRGRG